MNLACLQKEKNGRNILIELWKRFFKYVVSAMWMYSLELFALPRVKKVELKIRTVKINNGTFKKFHISS